VLKAFWEIASPCLKMLGFSQAMTIEALAFRWKLRDPLQILPWMRRLRPSEAELPL